MQKGGSGAVGELVPLGTERLEVDCFAALPTSQEFGECPAGFRPCVRISALVIGAIVDRWVGDGKRTSASLRQKPGRDPVALERETGRCPTLYGKRGLVSRAAWRALGELPRGPMPP